MYPQINPAIASTYASYEMDDRVRAAEARRVAREMRRQAREARIAARTAASTAAITATESAVAKPRRARFARRATA